MAQPRTASNVPKAESPSKASRFLRRRSETGANAARMAASAISTTMPGPVTGLVAACTPAMTAEMSATAAKVGSMRRESVESCRARKRPRRSFAAKPRCAASSRSERARESVKRCTARARSTQTRSRAASQKRTTPTFGALSSPRLVSTK